MPAAAAARTRATRPAVVSGRRGAVSTARAASRSSGGSDTQRASSVAFAPNSLRRDAEAHHELGAALRARTCHDLAPVPGHDLPGDVEPEAAAGLLGREEGLEDALHVAGRNAGARIRHLDDD